MNYTHLGRTGLKVSRIALGCMNFGELTGEADSFRIMDAALDAGINFFDTADVYGGLQTPDMPKGFGTSEEYIGNWLAQDKSRRDRIVLATKVYQPMETGPNDKYLSAYHIRRACEASLKRLKTDHIDLYQMHHVDRATPWGEIWQAFEQLIRKGKITEGRRATPGLQAQIQKFRPQLEAYEALCHELGQSPAVVALAWVFHNPVVTSAISGPRTVEQLRENLKALSLNLSGETLAKLDEIWPGPGGEAPQAYAW